MTRTLAALQPQDFGVADVNPEPPILIRLLGDIRVVGGDRSLKAKPTAVLAYLALHPSATPEEVARAIWLAPGTRPLRKRLANCVSECRRALGVNNIPLVDDGRYRVGPCVLTDLELFEKWIAAARQPDNHAADASLRRALELVEGPAFTYRHADRWSYVWVDLENWIGIWEQKVVDAAEDLVQRCLQRGDRNGAIWAAQRGLRARPANIGLTKLLIEAHFAGGDAKAAERVFQSHLSALAWLDLDDEDPELIDFFHESWRAASSAAS